MKARITVIIKEDNKKLGYEDVLEFKKDSSNKLDPHTILVFLNGAHIGYVANQADMLLEGSASATEIIEKTLTRGTVVTLAAENSKPQKYLVEVEFTEPPASEIEFYLIGGISTFPSKIDLLREIERGPQTVLLCSEAENIVGYYEGHPVGKVKAEDADLERLKSFLEDVNDVRVQAIGKSKGNILCQLKIAATPVVKKRNALEDILLGISEKGIDEMSSLIEKMEYMLANGVSKENVSDVFLSYVKYGPEEKARINKPKTLYIDSSGIVNDSIIYILEGRNLLYEGDKGVGKNVLTETVAWLFGRPLYEFSSNSQHSNNSLMGGETFKSPNPNKEEEKTVVGFLKKSISRFFAKTTDDRELDAISHFVKNAFGKDDKELVFQMSSILEAFTKGGIIVLDEFNTSQAHVMPLFNALLDERRRIEVTGLGKVEAHPNFLAIGTQNKGYQGTFDSNEATVDRFEPLIFPALESITKLLEMKNPDMGYETIDICNKLYMGIKKGVEAGTLGQDSLSTRGFISAAKAISRGMSVKRALINSVANRASDLDDREAIKNMIDLQVNR